MNPFLFKVLASVFPLQWGTRYSRVDKTPTHLEFTLLTRIGQIKHLLRSHEKRRSSLSYQQSESYRRLLRRFTAFSVPSRDTRDEETTELPAVRLLWVTHPKDADVLIHSVAGALRHVRNPIEAIDFVTPSPAEIENRIRPQLPPTIPVSFLRDDDVVSQDLCNQLAEALSSHGSWAVQQLIKVLHVLEHPDQPALVIDADTVLLRDKVWFSAERQQTLYSRAYLNPRYHDYLRCWGVDSIDNMRSFVTHHMLFQPDILRESLTEIFGSTDPASLVVAIVEAARELGFPEFSLDYELYGNMLWAKHPERFMLDKYSNIGLERPSEHLRLSDQLETLRTKGNYNSVSFHLPNR